MDVGIRIERAFGSGSAVEVVVILPTFRRPDHLLRTLASLDAQTTSRSFAIVVMDNDADAREGIRAAIPWFADRPRRSGLVLIAHERGNCSAYNAGIAAALAHYPAFTHLAIIDDDEIAAPDWIDRLISASDELGADIVGGPQRPVFEDALAGERWARHPVFTPPYARTGRVPILYSSGNAAIRRHVLEQTGEPWLDPVFNFIGGGDSDFYSRCRSAGHSFAWCAEAIVEETMPARRTEPGWVRARSVRNGAISAIIERRRGPGALGTIRRVSRTFALLGVSPFRAIGLAAKSRSLAIGLYHAQVAAGRVEAEFGRVAEQYRRPEDN